MVPLGIGIEKNGSMNITTYAIYYIQLLFVKHARVFK